MTYAVTAAVTVLTVASTVQANKARGDQRRAAAKQARQSAISNRREKIKALSQARVMRASQVSGSEAMGTSGGTGAAAAIGSTQSQTFNNVAFQQQIEGLNQERMKLLNRANRRQGQSAMYGQMASFASLAGGGSGDVMKDLGGGIAKGKNPFA
jgi:hypothetical protein